MNAAVQQQLTNLLRANSMTPDTLDVYPNPTFSLSNADLSLWRGRFHPDVPHLLAAFWDPH
mgnify:CR=1 FL=1